MGRKTFKKDFQKGQARPLEGHTQSNGRVGARGDRDLKADTLAERVCLCPIIITFSGSKLPEKQAQCEPPPWRHTEVVKPCWTILGPDTALFVSQPDTNYLFWNLSLR